MPYWDRAYGARQANGGQWDGRGNPGRGRAGNILSFRIGVGSKGRSITGSGGGQGGDRQRGRNDNQGQGKS